MTPSGTHPAAAPGRDTSVVTVVVDAPWGPVRIAAAATGVVALEQLSDEAAFVGRLVRRGYRAVALDAAGGDGAPDGAAAAARAAAEAVARYLAGALVDLGALPVDLADRPLWDRAVLDGVRTIARGETASYAEVARRIGRPGAARAVGGAVGRNPVGLLVPCHRVIAADGTLGGYGVAAYGGREAALDLKRTLLGLEGVTAGQTTGPRVSAG